MPLHIVLVEPEIHANVGNIARTCACTGMRLHLIHPLGFSMTDAQLRRAGLDYWHYVAVEHHNSFDEFYAAQPRPRLFFTTPDGDVRHVDVRFRRGDYIVFGKESVGLADYILEQYPGMKVRLPMLPGRRSLNLSNSVAVVAYEALRQLGFPGMV